MSEHFCSVAGYSANRMNLYVPQWGPWWASAVLADTDEKVTGKVEVTIGGLSLWGTVEESPGADSGLIRSLRIVGGAGKWGSFVERKSYHASSGNLDRRMIVEDIAREVGETLGTIEFEVPTIGDHYVRRVGPASVTLERLLEGRAWWVGQDGKTYGGTRKVTDVEGNVQVDHFDAKTNTALLSMDDPADLWVGVRIASPKLVNPQIIRDLEIEVNEGKCIARVFTGGTELDKSRLARAFEALLEQRENRKLFGSYRYSVHADPGDGTLSLRAVRPLAGLPDVLPVLQSSGIAGGISKLQKGQIVRVQFDEGDASMPYVSSYPAGKPGETAGIARESDLALSGGPGTVAVFSVGPIEGGFVVPSMALGVPTPSVPSPTYPVVVAGLPYLVSFRNVGDLDPESVALLNVPPVPTIPETQGLLSGFIASSSEQQIT